MRAAVRPHFGEAPNTALEQKKRNIIARGSKPGPPVSHTSSRDPDGYQRNGNSGTLDRVLNDGRPMMQWPQGARAFVTQTRVARLGTASRKGVPQVVAVCFVVMDDHAYITIDQKPKRPMSKPLKRIRNIIENPAVCLTCDHYEENWDHLGWVMLHGHARITSSGEEHDAAQAALVEKYPQYRTMDIAALPVIAIDIQRVAAWGTLAAPK